MMIIGKTMSKKVKQKAGGYLAELLASHDKAALAKTKNKMLVAAKIDIALRQKGVSQKEFAAMMHKPESEISEWLSGDRNFTIDTLTEISEALSVDLLNTSLVNLYSISPNEIREKIHPKIVVFKEKATPYITYNSNVKFNAREKSLIEVI